MDKPERDNPHLVRAIVDAGGDVQFVSGIVPSLEETYLKLLATEKDTGRTPRRTRGQHPARHDEKNAR